MRTPNFPYGEFVFIGKKTDKTSVLIRCQALCSQGAGPLWRAGGHSEMGCGRSSVNHTGPGQTVCGHCCLYPPGLCLQLVLEKTKNTNRTEDGDASRFQTTKHEPETAPF